MSVIDVLIVIIFVGAIIYGLYKGVISQLGSLGGVILGIIACRLFGGAVTRLVADILPAATSDAQTSAYVNSVIGNVLLFLIVFLFAILIARLLKNITHALSLGFVDRVLGAIFGLFKWFLIFSIILNLWQAFVPDTNFVKASSIGGGVAAKAILDLAPTLFGSIVAV